MSRLINNRFLPQKHKTEGELLVYEGLDEATGQKVEIIRPSKRAQMRHGGETFFLETQHSAGSNPSEQKPLWVGQDEKGPLAIFSEPLQPYSNIDLTPDEAMHILRWLVPALNISAQGFSKGLRPADLGLTKEGQLWLRPSGILPTDSLSDIDPYKTQGTSLEQAIYGLGLILYESLTEKLRFTKKSALEQFKNATPSLRTRRPNLPEDLIEIIDTMLDSIPQSRIAVISKIEACSEPPILNIPEKKTPLPNVVTTKPVQQRTSHTSLVKEDTPLPRHVLLLNTKSLPDAIRRNASALANIDDETLRLNMNQDKPLPIAGTALEPHAEALQALLKEHGIKTEIQSLKPNIILPSITTSLAFFCFYLLWTMGGLLFMISGSFLIGLSFLLFFRQGDRSSLQKSWNDLHLGVSRPEHFQQSEDLLQNARASILRSQLPQIAQIELLSSIDELQNGLSLKMNSGSELTLEELEKIQKTSNELINSAQSFSLEDPLNIEDVQQKARRISAFSQNINI
ncbi:MAG: hypothetical protein CMK59_05965 [Proteobacteria bacterium]|nr:hypothetical protein [Pseudomonadota bacterium]